MHDYMRARPTRSTDGSAAEKFATAPDMHANLFEVSIQICDYFRGGLRFRSEATVQIAPTTETSGELRKGIDRSISP